MEVSSHALVLQRVANVRFAAGIFTNLTRDHLDFHGDMQQYFAAKRRLFEMLPAGAPAIVNVDDPRGVELAARVPAPVTYAIDRPADVRATSIQSSLEGLAFRGGHARAGRSAMRSPLVGRPNVYNILGVVAAAIGAGLADGRHRIGHRAARARARTLSDRLGQHRRRARRRRLRAHRRRAEESARDGAAAGAGPADHRVRLRRRSRSHQAPADGRRRRQAERSRRADVRQPAIRGSAADHRRDQARPGAARPIPARPGGRARRSSPIPIAVRRSSRRSAPPSPAISSSSPARVTRSTRSSATARCRSTTSRSRRRRSSDAAAHHGCDGRRGGLRADGRDGGPGHGRPPARRPTRTVCSTRSRPTRGHSRPARCSWRSGATASTVTRSWRRPRAAARPACSSKTTPGRRRR